MKRSLWALMVVGPLLALAGCASQQPAPARPVAPTRSEAPARSVAPIEGPAARLVELPGKTAAGAPREVKVLVEEPGLKLVSERFRIEAAHAVVLAPKVPHAVEPDAGSTLVLLVHHLGRGEESHR